MYNEVFPNKLCTVLVYSRVFQNSSEEVRTFAIFSKGSMPIASTLTLHSELDLLYTRHPRNPKPHKNPHTSTVTVTEHGKTTHRVLCAWSTCVIDEIHYPSHTHLAALDFLHDFSQTLSYVVMIQPSPTAVYHSLCAPRQLSQPFISSRFFPKAPHAHPS